jgi:hypothetical protein
MENLELTNETDIINIKKIKNELQFAIIDILYKNADKEFTKKTLYNELFFNNKLNINTSFINNKDIYIIYCFIWTLLLKNSNFIINRNDTYIKIKSNSELASTDKIDNILVLTEEISTNYFIKHIIKYKEIYFNSKYIEYFIKTFEFNDNESIDINNLIKILLPKSINEYSIQNHESSDLYTPNNIKYYIIIFIWINIIYYNI